MLAVNFVNQAALRYGIATTPLIEGLFVQMGVDQTQPLSAEDFAVKVVELLTNAENALPDTLKQNNFGYGIGESGAYRGTIKATVSTILQVVG